MRKDLIESYIGQLQASLGKVRKPIDEEELQTLYDEKNYTGMVLFIQKALHLDMRISLGLVNSGGPNAPAWVTMSPCMPAYGTQAFRQTIIPMYFRKSFLHDASFEETVLAIAHECCHIVLNATGHQLRNAEEAVDLTAMLLGFRDFYLTGCYSVRKIVNQSELHPTEESFEAVKTGYLSREEVRHAAMFMTFQ